VACLLSACGERETPPQKATSLSTAPTRGIVTTIPATGPEDPGANLEKLVRAGTPELKELRVACPRAARTPRYPFECRLTALDRDTCVNVAGRVTVFGVYAPTRTYAFELSFRPQSGS